MRMKKFCPHGIARAGRVWYNGDRLWKSGETMRKILCIVLCVLLAVGVLVAGLGFVITPKAAKAPNDPVEGVKPFSASSGLSCNYYRIPALWTTQSGTVLAAIDARYGGTHDSPNNIDAAVSRSCDAGQSWDAPLLVAGFRDWANDGMLLKSNGSYTVADSASVIDPALLEDTATGRIFLLMDAFPANAGAPASEVGTGYTQIDGQPALLLRKAGETEFSYTLREDGAIYDEAGAKTEYTVNARGEILENGQPLFLAQRRQKYWFNVPYAVETGEQVPMHIFYDGALFSALGTSYLYLLYSDDDGKTWSEPVELNAQVKPENVGFFGVSPGRGVQLTTGAHKGRLLFTAYALDAETGEQQFAALYSDDGGETWQSGEFAALTDEIRSMSETQLVECPDGSLLAFSRTTSGYVSVARSTNGGESWSAPTLDDTLPLSAGSGCQVSALRINRKLDGKDVVLLSAPAGEGRKNGFLYVGVLDADEAGTYGVDWKYKKELTDANTYFAYSCLTELPDGNIGLLYEQTNIAQSVDTVVFSSYTFSELCEAPLD